MCSSWGALFSFVFELLSLGQLGQLRRGRLMHVQAARLMRVATPPTKKPSFAPLVGGLEAHAATSASTLLSASHVSPQRQTGQCAVGVVQSLAHLLLRRSSFCV